MRRDKGRGRHQNFEIWRLDRRRPAPPSETGRVHGHSTGRESLCPCTGGWKSRSSGEGHRGDEENNAKISTQTTRIECRRRGSAQGFDERCACVRSHIEGKVHPRVHQEKDEQDDHEETKLDGYWTNGARHLQDAFCGCLGRGFLRAGASSGAQADPGHEVCPEDSVQGSHPGGGHGQQCPKRAERDAFVGLAVHRQTLPVLPGRPAHHFHAGTCSGWRTLRPLLRA
mmetsp:Transcript_44723/g.96474  ORF Transcript_44723/g.96474 Transcript_44723/m.96474 type:complete len:227 (+) Transcript_44723:544-1224(+)